MRKQTEVTATTVVLAALRRADDFRTVAQLALEVGQSRNRVSAALHHLRNHHVVDCMESDGQLWWYALPPEGDTRSTTVEERTPELKPRKPRKSRAPSAPKRP